MTASEFLNRFFNGPEFSEEELELICLDLAESSECLSSRTVVTGEDDRWCRSVVTIFTIKEESGKEMCFAISWEEGLTEDCTNYFNEQPIIVTPHSYTKTVEVVDYINPDDGSIYASCEIE